MTVTTGTNGTGGIRHFTASAIVIDDHDRVLLIEHNKIGLWLYPGGHVDPNEEPAQAAVREVKEEAGIHVRIIAEDRFQHPAVATVPSPLTILVMDVNDSKVGRHQHIDMIYACRPRTIDLTHQVEEVSAAQWVPLGDVATLPTPPELPALIATAAKYVAANT